MSLVVKPMLHFPEYSSVSKQLPLANTLPLCTIASTTINSYSARPKFSHLKPSVFHQLTIHISIIYPLSPNENLVILNSSSYSKYIKSNPKSCQLCLLDIPQFPSHIFQLSCSSFPIVCPLITPSQ